jgi:metal-dependent hydrolase (beta-lactamase superfamily II)
MVRRHRREAVFQSNGTANCVSGRKKMPAVTEVDALEALGLVLLFDAGPAAATFQRNAEILGVDFASIEAVVLSHGHWDHAGGLHLSRINERVIPQTVADLKKFGLRLLAGGHCTGWQAQARIAREFGEELVPSAVGKKYLI